MRSHMMHLPIVPKPNLEPEPEPEPEPSPPPPQTPSCGTDSGSATESPSLSDFVSSSDSDQDEILKIPDKVVEVADDDNIDDEFPGSSSLITLQDRESETESLKKKNPTRKRRSKRVLQKPSYSTSSDYHLQQHYYYHEDHEYHQHHRAYKKLAPAPVPASLVVEVDPPVSSISEVTSEEDLALCLMMMSRDKWNTKFEVEIDGSSTRSTKKKYKCDTCNRVFRSYQALGGHRASHKKFRGCDYQPHQQTSSNLNHKLLSNNEDDNYQDNNDDDKDLNELEKKVHECPVCFRVFASGQALGGHKRSHVIAPSPKKVISCNTNYNESLIDLNLPAPVDDEDDSAVSDVHF